MIAHDEAAGFAEAILRLRRGRGQDLPRDLFGEIGWDMLLSLFVADGRGQRLTAREIAQQIGSALPTTSRWLRFLSEQRLVVGDGDGDIDDHLTLSATALDALENYMEQVREVIRLGASGERIRDHG